MRHTSQSSSIAPTLIEPQKRMPAWRLWVPLLLQTAIVLAAPAQPLYTNLTGKTVVLKTVPVDPYDFLRGYSQTLNYDISRQENLRSLPGWKALVKQHLEAKATDLPPSVPPLNSLPTGIRFYVILEAPAAKTNSPQAWKPVRVSSKMPKSLPANQIALKGKSSGNSIDYGLESYYMPEARRDEINQEINQAQSSRQRQAIVVEAKVDAQGRAVPISFWVSARRYRF
ncbi:GDYXXLXY domain-containing protein [Coleofasciculus sp. FACHB-SPT36]|uniref:GDYXXLXY domain-containing protein n=1 Tax=Cyanophyceae TaxID=3028117 RepID=UPI00168BCCE9|nr:GDYXXLXY domain-containing protein [Coleofasciculus sp. FACHB-SPT36]MBD2539124.1 GDYXXLXY domain-containing protein [Coleofasciculus sp. FACHB-SPT36]